MRALQEIITDIRNGDNIDLYVTLAVSVVFALLDVVGLVSVTLLMPLSLAVFALLTYTLIGNRHRLQQIGE